MFFLKLKFGPAWDDIAIIRNFIIAMLSSKITDYAAAYRVALAASELIENACKYSRLGGASIEMQQQRNNSELVLCIKNITDSAHIADFQKIHKLVYSKPAKASYREMMLRSLEREDSKQLGLSRIRYEGQAELSFTVEDDLSGLLHPAEQGRDNTAGLCVLCVQITTTITPKGDKGAAHAD